MLHETGVSTSHAVASQLVNVCNRISSNTHTHTHSAKIQRSQRLPPTDHQPRIPSPPPTTPHNPILHLHLHHQHPIGNHTQPPTKPSHITSRSQRTRPYESVYPAIRSTPRHPSTTLRRARRLHPRRRSRRSRTRDLRLCLSAVTYTCLPHRRLELRAVVSRAFRRLCRERASGYVLSAGRVEPGSGGDGGGEGG